MSDKYYVPEADDEGSGAADMTASMWAEWINDTQPVSPEGEQPAPLDFDSMTPGEQAIIIASLLIHEND